MIEIKYKKLFVLQAIIIGSLGAAFFVFFRKDFSSIFYTLFWMIGITINTFFIHRFTIPSKLLLKKLNLAAENDFSWDDINESLDKKNQQYLKNKLQTENEENKYQLLLDQLEDPVFLINKQQQITYINLAFKNLSGIENSELPLPLFEFSRNFEFINFIKDSIREERTSNLTFFSFDEIPTPNKVFFDIKFFYFKNDLESLCLLHNVTEKKLTEQVREDFIANFSHEVRTPLTILNGLIQSLKNQLTPQNDEVSSLFYKIDLHANRLNNLFDSLLTLSSIEFKKDIRKEEINVEDPIRFLVQDLEFSYKSKNISFKYHFDHSSFFVDYNLFLQLVTNLISNSLKYGKSNGIIEITTEQSENFSIISVQDDGIGIPKEHQSRIFERFFRVDSSHSSNVLGNGIGLSIVKHIVLKHNGKIKVESESNKGAKFIIYFPKA